MFCCHLAFWGQVAAEKAAAEKAAAENAAAEQAAAEQAAVPPSAGQVHTQRTHVRMQFHMLAYTPVCACGIFTESKAFTL